MTITFTNLNEPSTSYAHHFRQPPHTATASTTSFAPSHRRSAHSVAYPSNAPNTPRTAAPFLNVTALPVDSPLAQMRDTGNATTPRRRSLIGKGKQREEADDLTDRSDPSHPSSVGSQFKKKHAPRSLSVSTYPTNNGIISPLARLPMLDTGQLDSSLTDCE